MAQIVNVGGVVAAGLGLGRAPEALAVRAVQAPAQHAREPADFAQPGVLPAFGNQLIALPPGQGVFEPVQRGVHAGRSVAALHGIEGHGTDVGALDGAGGRGRSFK
jgi:hypothetical protein